MSATSPNATFKRLAASALIGTTRAGGGKTAADDLLSQTALIGAQIRAGHAPRHTTARVQPCPPDDRTPAGPAASATLLRLLSDPEAALIEEWAELANARRWRVADSTAPLLLDWWARQPQRSAAIFAATGSRGPWLATMNPAWDKPVAVESVPADVEDIWQTGKAPARGAVLTSLRRADPDRARSMVESTWSTDGADERRRWLDILGEHASMADEPFLERALDDRSKTVRGVAAALLATLVGSRLRERMNARARTLVSVGAKRGLLKRAKVTVTVSLPSQFDPSWERDGIDQQAASGKGQKAWWMQQILSASDLSIWTDGHDAAPPEIIAAAAEDDFATTLITAMMVAARATRDGAWAAALVEHLLSEEKPSSEAIEELCATADGPMRETLLLAAASNEKLSVYQRWGLLARAPRWSREFTQRALVLLKPGARLRAANEYALREACNDVSRRIHPSAANDFDELVHSLFSDTLSESFKKAIDRVRLRADMHKEFAS